MGRSPAAGATPEDNKGDGAVLPLRERLAKRAPGALVLLGAVGCGPDQLRQLANLLPRAPRRRG